MSAAGVSHSYFVLLYYCPNDVFFLFVPLSAPYCCCCMEGASLASSSVPFNGDCSHRRTHNNPCDCCQRVGADSSKSGVKNDPRRRTYVSTYYEPTTISTWPGNYMLSLSFLYKRNYYYYYYSSHGFLAWFLEFLITHIFLRKKRLFSAMCRIS